MSKMPNPPEIQSIFHNVLQRLIPTNEELDHIKKTVESISSYIQHLKIPDDITINFIEAQGSTGIKQTSIRNSADIDLFIGLDPKYITRHKFPSHKERREFLHTQFKTLIQTWLMPCVKKLGFQNLQLSYAEHPYISGIYDQLEFDLVLCFNISAEDLQKNGPLTAMDRSPHHSRFVRDHLSQDQKNDVRLLKYFFQCQWSYGDKSPVGRSGFIGYVAELLIYAYGDLWTLFQHFDDLSHTVILPRINLKTENPIKANWKRPYNEIRDQYYPNDYLIILDPTDLHRNVGASISKRAFCFVRSQIQAFIQKPSLDFFEKRPIPSITSLKLKSIQLSCLFYAEYHVLVDDHYTKFRDKLYSIIDKVTRDSSVEPSSESRFHDVNGELLFDTTTNLYVLSFYTSTPLIDSEFIRIGPKVENHTNVQQFREKHSNEHIFIQNGYLCVKQTRPFTQFLEFLREILIQTPIQKLELIRVGCATDPDLSLLTSQSLANLFLNVLPYLNCL